jgi:tRNA(Ile2) C34 agmatinyltransferase TiaS
MTPKPSFQLCRHRRANDSACFKMPRCQQCHRVLKPFERGYICTDCRTDAREDDSPDVREGGANE